MLNEAAAAARAGSPTLTIPGNRGAHRGAWIVPILQGPESTGRDVPVSYSSLRTDRQPDSVQAILTAAATSHGAGVCYGGQTAVELKGAGDPAAMSAD